MKSIKSAFVLPVVLISGTAMLIILTFTLETVATTRSSILTSHFQLLARQAAESGLARAKSCIFQYNRTVTWTSDQPLTPDSDCMGNILTSETAPDIKPNLLEGQNFRSRFIVEPTDIQDKFKNVSAVGILEVLTTDTLGDTVVDKTFRHKMSAYITTSVTLDSVKFGSIYAFGTNELDFTPGPSPNEDDQDPNINQTIDTQAGVYFITKSAAEQKVSGAGANIDEVIRGWMGGFKGGAQYNYPTPYEITGLANKSIKDIFTDFQGNGWNIYFLTTDNEVYTTGVNGNAMMANGINKASGKPLAHPTFPGATKMVIPAGQEVYKIYGNGSAVYVLMKSGYLYTAGRNWSRNMLGCSPGCNGQEYVNTLTRVNYQIASGSSTVTNNKKIVFLAVDTMYYADQTTTYAITDTGEVYGWGSNECGQLGVAYSGISSDCANHNSNNTTNKYFGYGLKIGTFGPSLPAVDVKTDGQTVWILANKKVYSAGSNKFGQLARNSGDSYRSDVATIGVNASVKVVQIAADAYTALFLDENYRVWGVGLNDVGQLGSSPDKIFKTAKEVNTNAPGDKKISRVFVTSPGAYHSGSSSNPQEQSGYEARRYRNVYLISTKGVVYGFGSNYFGQLGLGNTTDIGNDSMLNPFGTKGAPMLVFGDKYSSDPTKRVLAADIRSGIGSTIIITDKNDVYTVGNNKDGQLGDKTTINRSTPFMPELIKGSTFYF